MITRCRFPSFRPQRLTIAVCAGLLWCGQTFAKDVQVALPEQSLAASINAIARQGQIQVLYDATAVKQLRAPALNGTFTPETALQKILLGTGLEMVPQGTGFVVRPQKAARDALVIPETSVQGVVGRHPATDVMSAPQYLTSEEIAQRNTGDGNVTELLKTNPAVQFANGDSSSLNQGEIKPSRISINGASSFQNAYKLDGVNFNNDFDPAKNDNGETETRIDTGDQGIYIDSRLIDSVTVYDNNIPVEYGGFTGGTVDVTSRRWRGENSAHAYYRTTQSSWTKLFNDEAQPIDSSKNDTSNPARFQNRYNKEDFGGWFETGVTDNSGLLFSASRRSSTIPMYTTGGEGVILNEAGEFEMIETGAGRRNQKRVSDNFFLKYSMNLSTATTVDISGNYADYQSRLFSSSVLNSGYDNAHTGLGFTSTLKHRMTLGELEFTGSYQKLRDERTTDQGNYVEVLDYPDWSNPLSLRSGGPGNLISEQETLSAKSVMRFNETEWLGMLHQPTIGFEVNNTEGRYIRRDDYYRYRLMTYGFMDMLTMNRFLAGTYSANYTSYSLFADDTLRYGRLTVRPGVRLDRDDFVEQTNIAPRLSATYDLFGDSDTLLIGGLNRYYGRSMLTYALYGAQNAGLQNCNYCSLDPNDPSNYWEQQKDFEGLDSLSTPYNDELTLAVQQRVLSTTWRLQYVHREGHDEVRSRTKYPGTTGDESKIRTFDNGGRSSHDAVTLSVRNSQPWEWADATHVLNGSISWQQSKNNTPSDQGYAFFDPNTRLNSDKVWYNGKVIDAKDLPSTNYNSPLKFNLELTSEWQEYGLTLYNRLQWWGSRQQAVRYGNEYYNDPEFGQLRKYSQEHFASRYTWDGRVTWKPSFAYGASVSVEVNNILNNKNVADTFVYSDQVLRVFDPGRQFWLQMNYDF